MEPMVSDVLWRAFEPLIPKHPISTKGGRPRANDRICLEGLVYMLRSGTPWDLFPKAEFGVGKSTVYDRFTEWTKAGVFNCAHHELLNQLGLAGKIDLSDFGELDSTVFDPELDSTVFDPELRPKGAHRSQTEGSSSKSVEPRR